MSKKVKKAALGRGLSALLDSPVTAVTPEIKKDPSVLGSMAEINIDFIKANPNQPRTHFDEEALEELKLSIEEHGVIQPITVRKMGRDEYQIISGERRFRASQLAGKTEIPVYIRMADDQTVLEMALVENIQRQELDAIEIAISYQRLMDECEVTQDQVGKRVSKNRSTVTNYLRLLKLPAEIQSAIRDKEISMGHARALISVGEEKHQLSVYREIIEKGLSVRQVEEIARSLKNGTVPAPKKKVGSLKQADLSFEQQKYIIDLKRILDRPLSIKKDDSGKGKITIDFKNDEDLTRVLDLLIP